MSMNCKNRAAYCLVVIMLNILGVVFTANAEGVGGVEIFSITQTDLDSDGQPEVTIIDCAFATSHDRVLVYDGAGDMHAGDDWQTVTDFTNDTWVFDAGADGSAQLIVRFVQEARHSVAYFFDDQNGDGKVAYQLSGKDLIIVESAFWSLKVESDGYWFLQDGSLNLNLRFLIDGYLENVRVPQSILDLLQQDGQPDFESEVVDTDYDGIPEYVISRFLAPSPARSSFLRHTMSVNVGKSKTSLPESFVFWPFLENAGLISGQPLPVHFVGVDWTKARLFHIAPSLGFGEVHYNISGFNYWGKSQVNYSDFETPMAYYNLADDRDNRPELHIRLEYFGPFDPFLDVGPAQTPLNNIRYSWNQQNHPGLYWDYKVDLTGMNLITSSVWFKDFGVQMVPYETIPWWISDNTWALGALVANEGGGYPSDEGIYEWSTMGEIATDIGAGRVGLIAGSQQQLRNYLTGQTTTPPDNFYTRIRPGFRGEFGHLQDRPYLYFSPVDGRLHLRKATKGIWNVGKDIEVDYANVDGDLYLDEWRYLENGQVRRQLNVTAGYLLYTDTVSKTLLFKQAQVVPALFETFPPRNHAEWLALGRQLDTHKRDFAPGDFEAMLAQFDGPTLRIEGATLRDFRATEQGFRFVLELQAGFRVTGEDWPGIQGRVPGAYAVSYEGTFQVQPLTPAILQISPSVDPLMVEPPTAYIPGEAQFTLRNEGLEDAKTVLVTAKMSQSGQEVEWSTPQTVTVLAGETVPVRLPWTPRAAGTWQIRAEAFLLDSGGAVAGTATVEQAVTVQPAEETGFWETVGVFGLVSPGVVLLLLASVAVTGGLTAWALLRSVPPDLKPNVPTD